MRREGRGKVGDVTMCGQRAADAVELVSVHVTRNRWEYAGGAHAAAERSGWSIS
jgi:hypothetical protein